jgi:hypothetical protein
MRAPIFQHWSSFSISFWFEPRMKKPGAVSRPGTAREFQFREYSDLAIGVKPPKTTGHIR